MPTAGGMALYLSPSGNDSNPGTQAQPLRTFAKADSVATPGSVVNVLPGTYSTDVSIKNGGAANAPVVWQSTQKWGAQIVGAGASTGVVCINAPFVTFQGFDVTSSSTTQSGIEGDCSQTPNHDVHIVGNHVHDLGDNDSCPTGGAIESESGAAHYASSNQYIEGNFIERIGQGGGTGGKCQLFQGVYPASPNSVIRNNIITMVSSFCLHLFHSPSNNVVVNNTAVHCGSGALQVGSDTENVSGLLVSNNIFAESRVGIDTNIGGVGGGNSYGNNLLWGNGTDLKMGPGQSLGNTISAAPNFVNDVQGSGRDFHLRSGSPAINAGSTQKAPPTDFDGSSRPYECCWDIGAYEWRP